MKEKHYFLLFEKSTANEKFDNFSVQCVKESSNEYLSSLLQYMKDTDINNPNIVVEDERIKMLDKIVNEVKETEEWEDAEMDLIDIGIERGRQEGIRAFIDLCREVGKSYEETKKKIVEKFGIDEVVIQDSMKKYWKE